MRLRLLLSAAFACYLGLLISIGTAHAHGLDFVANGRQWPEQVRYKADIPGGAVFLTNTGFTYAYYSLEDIARLHDTERSAELSDIALSAQPVRCHAYSLNLEGCKPSSVNNPQQKQQHYYNYFLGNDPGRWSGGIPAFGRVDYEDVYEGIDLHVYSQESSLKYDFVLGPRADASAIRLSFEGVTPYLTNAGDILLRTSVNEVREKAPYAYQLVKGRKQQVACRYALRNGIVTFDFPNGYDHSRELIIDPVLVFATYSGATTETFGWSATYDSSGNLYAGGECLGTGWPVTTGAFQLTFGGLRDNGISKYSSNGNTLLYATYYGGADMDRPNSMIVNRAGELIIAGSTLSTNLPVTPGCFDNTHNDSMDLFVARFSASGAALLAASYLGGSGNEGNISTSIGVNANRGEVVLDTAGNIYIAFASSSPNFPTTPGVIQASRNGPLDAVIAKLNPTCSGLSFSTYLGGSDVDGAVTMQLGPGDELVIGGGTGSTNFPGTSLGWQSSLQGKLDGFVARLNNSGTAILSASYVGTAADDEVSKLQLDYDGNIFAAGTNLSGAFPVSPGTYYVPKGLNFIAKFDSSLAKRLLSTTIGDSSGILTTTAFLVDNCSYIYVVGFGNFFNPLPLSADAFQTTKGSFWMGVFNPNIQSISYASYFGTLGDHIDGGSSRLDPAGRIYHSLCTSSGAIPTTSGAYASAKNTTGFDIASWKYDFQQAGMDAGFTISPQDSFCAPGTIAFTNTSRGALSYLWDFGDGSPNSTLTTPPPHTYQAVGTYTIKLYSYNVASCKLVDSHFHKVYAYRVRDTVKLVPPDTLLICAGDTLRMQIDPRWNLAVSPVTNVSYQQKGGREIAFYPLSTTEYKVEAFLTNDCGRAEDSLRFVISIDTTRPPHINQMTDTILCKGDTAVFQLAHPLTEFSIHPPDHYQVSSDSMSIRFFPPVTSTYQFISRNAGRCITTRDTLNFRIHRSTVAAAFELTPKLTDMLAPSFRLTNRSLNATGYNWYIGESFWTTTTSPSLTAEDTGRYCFSLVARDQYACLDTATDCGSIFIPLIYIPTAFSPNGDLKNDIFRPLSHNVEILEFSVYNRYGQRVFVCFDNKSGWDGTFNGEPCDLDVYFYQVRYRILERDPVLLKGDVTLVR